MKRVLLLGLLALLAVSLTMAVPSYSRAGGGWGAGWFVGGLAMGSALGLAARPYYYPPPYYYYPPPAYPYPAPAYAYPPGYVYEPPPPSASAPPPQSAAVPPQMGPAGEGDWVTVPGQNVNGTWVPQHKVWVPKSQ
jgi:hypothetical protein